MMLWIFNVSNLARENDQPANQVNHVDIGKPVTLSKQEEMIVLQKATMLIDANMVLLKEENNYQQWTPSILVNYLLPQLNSASMMILDNNHNTFAANHPKITYIKESVLTPWQIVLIPLDDKGMIHVKAYGSNLIAPVFEKDIILRDTHHVSLK